MRFQILALAAVAVIGLSDVAQAQGFKDFKSELSEILEKKSGLGASRKVSKLLESFISNDKNLVVRYVKFATKNLSKELKKSQVAKSAVITNKGIVKGFFKGGSKKLSPREALLAIRKAVRELKASAGDLKKLQQAIEANLKIVPKSQQNEQLLTQIYTEVEKQGDLTTEQLQLLVDTIFENAGLEPPTVS